MSEISDGTNPASVSPPEWPRGPDEVTRAVGVARVVGTIFLGLFGLAFAAWTLTQYFASGRDEASMSEVGLSEGAPPGLGGASAADDSGMLKVYVMVRLLDDEDVAVGVGTSLPRHVSLKLVGGDGRMYEAKFDRVGVWLMEVPPGEYRIPAEQPTMGKRKWDLSGQSVVKDSEGGGYTATFERTADPQRMKLILRE